MSELPNQTYYLCDVTRKLTQTTTDGAVADRDEQSTMKARCRVYLTSNVPQSCLDVLLKVADISMWESPDPVPRGELLIGVRGVNALLCTSSDHVDKDVINSAGKFPTFYLKKNIFKFVVIVIGYIILFAWFLRKFCITLIKFYKPRTTCERLCYVFQLSCSPCGVGFFVFTS